MRIFKYSSLLCLPLILICGVFAFIAAFEGHRSPALGLSLLGSYAFFLFLILAHFTKYRRVTAADIGFLSVAFAGLICDLVELFGSFGDVASLWLIMASSLLMVFTPAASRIVDFLYRRLKNQP